MHLVEVHEEIKFKSNTGNRYATYKTTLPMSI